MEEEKKIKIITTKKLQKTARKKTTHPPINRKGLAMKIIIGTIVIAIIAIGLFFVIKIKKDNSQEEKSQNKNAQPSTPGKVVDTEILNEELPATPEVITQGRFNNVEQILEGKALFIESGKEKYLRFENFKVVNGQDIHVYLSPISNLDKSDVIDLGTLRSISGNFNYPLDKNIDLAKYNNVLIWSNTFNAFFGYASLLNKELPPEPQTLDNQNIEENNSQQNPSEGEVPQIVTPETEDAEPENQDDTENQEETNATE